MAIQLWEVFASIGTYNHYNPPTYTPNRQAYSAFHLRCILKSLGSFRSRCLKIYSTHGDPLPSEETWAGGLRRYRPPTQALELSILYNCFSTRP